MENEKMLTDALERIWSKDGGQELLKRVERGDFVPPQIEKVKAFIDQKQQQRLTAYLLSPEYSALRQAAAAEKANKTAHRALIVSTLATVVAFVALALQLLSK